MRVGQGGEDSTAFEILNIILRVFGMVRIINEKCIILLVTYLIV